MNIKTVAALACFGLSAPSFAAQPFSEHTEHTVEACVYTLGATASTACDYMVYVAPMGDKEYGTMFLIDNKNAVKRVADAVELRAQTNEHIVVGDCGVPYTSDSALVGLVNSYNHVTTPEKLWRVDFNTAKFISIPVDGMECIQGSGDEP